jgi:hypothetical protein
MSEIVMRRPASEPASESESESESASEPASEPESGSASESASESERKRKRKPWAIWAYQPRPGTWDIAALREPGSESGSETQRKRKRSPWATWTYQPPQFAEFAEFAEEAADAADAQDAQDAKVDVSSAEAARIAARLCELRDATHVPAFKLESPTREWFVPAGFDHDLAAVYFDFAAGNVARSHNGVFLDLHATQLAVPDHELSRFLIGAATAAHAKTLLTNFKPAPLGVVLLVSPHGLHVTYGLGHFLDDEPVTVRFPPPAPAALTANELAEKIARSAPEPNESPQA